jgi:uncharacterized protein (DUF1810 family)
VSAESFDLARFVDAQDAGGAYDSALAELSAGLKRGHWIWFVFPQVEGLGRSPTSQFFGVRGAAEAEAYVAHPVLGPRLVAAARALADLPGADPVAVLGSIDAVKVRSSMTLFAVADPDEPVYGEVLAKYYGGERDPATLSRL